MDERLPLGAVANTAAILGITMGMKMPDVVGEDVRDAQGNAHTGIIQFPVPILRGDGETLKRLRARLFESAFAELTVVDFSELAQSCKTYGEFIGRMAQTPETELSYIGVAICGDRKKVNKLTGSLPLLR